MRPLEEVGLAVTWGGPRAQSLTHFQQGQRRTAFLYHTPRGSSGQCSHSPAGRGRHGAWLLDLPLPRGPGCAGHQPQLWLHVSATALLILVS